MNNSVVIGVDPDSAKHGVAYFFGHKLNDIESIPRASLIENIKQFKESGIDVLVSIENVLANSFVYGRNNQATKAAQAKVGVSIGRCQQAQAELMRDLEGLNIPYHLHKPSRNNWAKDKERFERITGWQKRSNEDTRSAAYFGFIALNGVSS